MSLSLVSLLLATSLLFVGSAGGEFENIRHGEGKTPSNVTIETIVKVSVNGSDYSLEYIDPGLYIFGNGLYFGIFFTTGEGVVVVDAPAPMGGLISSIIESVTDELIKYVVYSHHHLDHIGGAWEFEQLDYSDDIIYICHEDTKSRIDESSNLIPRCDIGIRVNDMTSYDVESVDYYRDVCLNDGNNRGRHMMYKLRHCGIFMIGNQYIEFDYYGQVHSNGNLWISSKQHSFLMVVDFVYPGWLPAPQLAMSENPSKYISGHDIALDRYDFEYYLGGHQDRVGVRHDVELNKQFVNAVFNATKKAFMEIHFPSHSEILKQGRNAWSIIVNNFWDAITQRCIEILHSEYNDSEWYLKLAGVDVYGLVESHCWKMQMDFQLNI